MEELQIDKQIKQAQSNKAKYEKIKKELMENDIYKISTNTAFLQNIKLHEKFNGFGFFPDWLKIKHDQAWEKKIDGYVEVTFKFKSKKE